MFSEHKPIYFFLNNEGENYYLDSCLSFTADDYLWYRLKRDEMQCVYFLERTAEHSVRITIKDKDSFQNNSYGSKGFFQKRLWNSKAEDPQSDFVNIVPDQAAAQWVLDRMQEPNTAVVCDLATLQCLYTDPQGQEAFISGAASGKGSCILKYPICPDRNQLDLLVGNDSIFRKKVNGQCLLKPLYALLTSGNTRAAVFDELKKSIPDQSIEAGYLDFESLKILVRNVGFAMNLTFTGSEFLDHVNYLFYWLENPQVRKDSGGLFGNISGTITRKKTVRRADTGTDDRM